MLTHKGHGHLLENINEKLIEKYLIRIFHDQVFALIQFHADIDDTPQDTPTVVHVQGDLICKLSWLELLHAQNDVFGRVFDARSGYVAVNRY